jgi:hypothetical protein
MLTPFKVLNRVKQKKEKLRNQARMGVFGKFELITPVLRVFEKFNENAGVIT